MQPWFSNSMKQIEKARKLRCQNNNYNNSQANSGRVGPMSKPFGYVWSKKKLRENGRKRNREEK